MSESRLPVGQTRTEFLKTTLQQKLSLDLVWKFFVLQTLLRHIKNAESIEQTFSQNGILSEDTIEGEDSNDDDEARFQRIQTDFRKKSRQSLILGNSSVSSKKLHADYFSRLFTATNNNNNNNNNEIVGVNEHIKARKDPKGEVKPFRFEVDNKKLIVDTRFVLTIESLEAPFTELDHLHQLILHSVIFSTGVDVQDILQAQFTKFTNANYDGYGRFLPPADFEAVTRGIIKKFSENHELFDKKQSISIYGMKVQCFNDEFTEYLKKELDEVTTALQQNLQSVNPNLNILLKKEDENSLEEDVDKIKIAENQNAYKVGPTQLIRDYDDFMEIVVLFGIEFQTLEKNLARLKVVKQKMVDARDDAEFQNTQKEALILLSEGTRSYQQTFNLESLRQFTAALSELNNAPTFSPSAIALREKCIDSHTNESLTLIPGPFHVKQNSENILHLRNNYRSNISEIHSNIISMTSKKQSEALAYLKMYDQFFQAYIKLHNDLSQLKMNNDIELLLKTKLEQMSKHKKPTLSDLQSFLQSIAEIDQELRFIKACANLTKMMQTVKSRTPFNFQASLILHEVVKLKKDKDAGIPTPTLTKVLNATADLVEDSKSVFADPNQVVPKQAFNSDVVDNFIQATNEISKFPKGKLLRNFMLGLFGLVLIAGVVVTLLTPLAPISIAAIGISMVIAQYVGFGTLILGASILGTSLFRTHKMVSNGEREHSAPVKKLRREIEKTKSIELKEIHSRRKL